MTVTHVADLKQRLSHYLNLVQQGDEVIVTSHQKRIARIISEEIGTIPIRLPTKPVSSLPKIGKSTKPNKSIIMLLADRGRR